MFKTWNLAFYGMWYGKCMHPYDTKQITKAIQSIQDNVDRFNAQVNTKPMLDYFSRIQQMQERLAKVTMTPHFVKAINDRIETHRKIVQAISNINANGLSQYSSLLTDSVIKDDKFTVEEVDAPVLREIEESLPVFEAASKKADTPKETKKVIATASKGIKKHRKENPEFRAWFSREGEMWHFDKDGEKHKEEFSDKMFLVLEILELDGSFVKTKDLCRMTGYASSTSLGNAISSLKSKMKNMGCDFRNPIQGRQPRGYRLHPDLYLSKEYGVD